jgi:hypothetical protein
VDRLSRRLRSFGACLGALILLAHCGGSDLTLPSETKAASIAKVAGDGQTGAPGSSLNDSLVVKVVDGQGEPVAGERVAFVLEGNVPGASVSPDQARTGTDGVAWTRWVVGSTSGTQAVVAQVVGVDRLQVRFQAIVGSGNPASIEAVDGSGQSGPVGTALTDPLAVRVIDEFGNPVAGVEVEWDAQDGSMDPSSSRTGADGRALSSWVLGSSTGSQTATASSSDLAGSPVTFTATAEAGSANSLVRVSGNNQSGRPGEVLDQPLVVRLVDEAGNGIPDRAVTWVVGAGAGSVGSTTSSTDGNGEAQARWTLGSSPGTNTLNAVVSGVGVVGFTATATSGGGGGGGGSSPSRLEFRVQPLDTEEDRRIDPPVEVVVLDQQGNRVTDGRFRINLELLGDDGSLKGDRSRQTESGVATFDDLKVDKDGDYRLRASADGLPSVESRQFHIRERDD